MSVQDVATLAIQLGLAVLAFLLIFYLTRRWNKARRVPVHTQGVSFLLGILAFYLLPVPAQALQDSTRSFVANESLNALLWTLVAVLLFALSLTIAYRRGKRRGDAL